ncbi:MAG: response regulator [Alphaproteobacteria bacterium]|nr:response regulator [Alphaproteobacteria bacterium]
MTPSVGRAVAQRAERQAPPDLATPLVARILIVDDDERNAFAAVQALEELGHELVVARSGEEALRRLLTEEFAVILLDLHMPGMDGYETAELIRMRRRTSHTPIVFLTAIFRDEAHVFQAYSAGAVDVVFKPVDPFILKSKVSVLVDLYLKTEEVKRQSAYQQWLLDEHARVKAEKAQTERVLRQTEARQEAILQSLPIVFTSRALEPPFAVKFVSHVVEDVTGFPAERFTRDPEFGLSRVHAEDVERVREALVGAAATGRYACEFRWLCADGEYRVMQDQGVLAPPVDGAPREIFGVLLDATDRRQLEEQLAQARKMEAVGQLTGGVAHDFNNLLTPITGALDMLQRKYAEADPRSARLLANALQAADRAKTLVQRLLGFARRQTLETQPVDVPALLSGMRDLIASSIGSTIELRVRHDRDLPAALGDPNQLELAILNLCVNARDAMPNGGPLTITVEEVAIGPGSEAKLSPALYVRVSVIDAGCGMDAETLARAVEPFYSTKETGRGTGLGLSMVHGLAAQLGGGFTLSSEPGRGTRADLYLPISDDVEPRAATRAARPASLPGRPLSILLVDDEEIVRVGTGEMIRDLGHSVVEARGGAEALALLREGMRPDVVITDYKMPRMDGSELARRIHESYPSMPLLLITGYTGRTEELPHLPRLAKPFGQAEIASALATLLVEDDKVVRLAGAKREPRA